MVGGFSESTNTPAVTGGLLTEDLTLMDGGRTRMQMGGDGNYSDFGSILFGIVDVLAIVPVASGDKFASNGEVTRPGGSTSCIFRRKGN